MEKIIYCLAIATTLFACQTKTVNTENADIPANATGYNLDSTENTATVLKAVKAMETLDTVAYRSFYVPDVIFHDNLDTTNLDQNVSMISSFKANGITVKITSVSPIWELINKKPSPTGVTNYVISYQLADFIKGDKTVKVIMNSVDAFKDGKIVEEWNTYDTRKIYELLK
jgi:hypothetical protein